MSIPQIADYQLPADIAIDNKVNWSLNGTKAALLVHDMQQYFCSFYAPDSSMLSTVTTNIANIIASCRSLGVPVFYTAQPINQPPAKRGLLTDMWGEGIDKAPHMQHIIAALKPHTADSIITKWRYSAFYGNDFYRQLQQKQVEQLIICGIYANIGCLCTAIDAFMHNIKPFFIADGVADFSQQQHIQAVEYVASKVGMVLSTAQLLEQLTTNRETD